MPTDQTAAPFANRPPRPTVPPPPPLTIGSGNWELTAEQQIRARALDAAAIAWTTKSTAKFDPNNLPPTVLITARRFARYIETGE